jgi:16S rRNA (guanine527-N7)-methyltransferase
MAGAAAKKRRTGMKKEILERLSNGAAELGIDLQDKHLQRFSLYGDFLIEYNDKVNLTALTDEEEVMEKHFIDSLSVLQMVHLRPSMSVIDIGTGAGFHGVPLLFWNPNLQLTLLDSCERD